MATMAVRPILGIATVVLDVDTGMSEQMEALRELERTIHEMEVLIQAAESIRIPTTNAHRLQEASSQHERRAPR